MKKNLNIIQIKGFRGILYIAFIISCLAVGFGWFPGWICMKLWNIIAAKAIQIPAIGIIQGMLLWGIIAASYFTFRKDKLVVCMKASDELSEEELRSVFENMKKQAKEDVFLRNIIKTQNAELHIKDLSKSKIPGINITELEDLSQIKTNNEQTEKVETK